MPVLETFAGKQQQVNGRRDSVQLAAQAALQKLRNSKPLAVPEEIVELRKEVKGLHDKNTNLEDKLKDLEARLDALRSTD